ncbi:Uracil-DNA glycosylase [Klebsormidium nitens]|uniref:Uracil-DNA glycosylase n=1 Tax=Klebsormidium nitens TaxID=105231 RepID=A0A1Y1HI68_KLENI|nr:Uracil-DNA glycosylase [Klebsormidium nitens]|eukprot:GAQ78165.1 Uracil-DNA glycosylase [Klebsormidium nitens]
MAQKGITSFFQAPSKSCAAGIVRTAALSSPEAKLLGSTTPEVRLLKNSAALNVASTNPQNVLTGGDAPAGISCGVENQSTTFVKHRLPALDLAPSLAKRARTDANPIRAQTSAEGPASGGQLEKWEEINAEATTSGRPPLSPKFKKKARAFEGTPAIQSEEAQAEEQIGKEGPRGDAPLSEEQRLRIEVNKASALAKLAQRKAEDVVAAAHARGEALPRLADLFLDSSWLAALPGELEKAYFANLEKFVSQEVSGKVPVFPPQASIFRAFNTCPFDRVKVVILGQDPYHGPGQAMGLSFSVPAGVRIPSSLQNIFKELQDDLGCTIPQSGDLQKWASQGVLLLNTVLTVRQGQANSHAKRGWELFTDAAIRALSKQRKGVVFLLWGRPAQEKLRLIDATSHHVLKCAHPSGLSAHRGFFGCKHFSQTNKILHDAGQLPIDWQL